MNYQSALLDLARPIEHTIDRTIKDATTRAMKRTIKLTISNIPLIILWNIPVALF